MKTCFKCGIEKPFSEYYKQPKMASGTSGKCKECTKSAARAYRAENIEKVRAYDRSRSLDPDRVRSRSEYQRTENGKSAIAKARKKYIKDNPEKRAAHVYLGNAKRDGRIAALPCFVCGNLKTEAHHADYGNPLGVTWLCPRHHKAAHKIVLDYNLENGLTEKRYY